MNLLNIGTVVLVVLLIFDFEDSCINTSFLLDYEDVAKYKKKVYVVPTHWSSETTCLQV